MQMKQKVSRDVVAQSVLDEEAEPEFFDIKIYPSLQKEIRSVMEQDSWYYQDIEHFTITALQRFCDWRKKVIRKKDRL